VSDTPRIEKDAFCLWTYLTDVCVYNRRLLTRIQLRTIHLCDHVIKVISLASTVYSRICWIRSLSRIYCIESLSSCERESFDYGVALVSRIDKIIGLFCKRALQKRQYSAKETYNFIDPTDRGHPIHDRTEVWRAIVF